MENEPAGDIIRESSNLCERTKQKRSFVIDEESDQFLIDGEPLQCISGSLHYFRVPHQYWRDRLRKCRAAGLDAVCTAVEWSIHEPEPEEYVFTGNQDLEHFLDLAMEEDLLVILQPGPYICADRDFGGFPPWLLNEYPNIALRTDDSDYENMVQNWFVVLFSKLEKYLYANGGPIIMIQVEHSYGNCGTWDINHKLWMGNLLKSLVKEKALLFTTDAGYDETLNRGSIPGIYATVAFGAGMSTTESFGAMRKYSPAGPLVNSEFYVGWFGIWGEEKQPFDLQSILRTMKKMLLLNASFNIFMFHGGTNFGFMNGANCENDVYEPHVTSYDYEAPLNEAGDPTPTYYAIRKLIYEHFNEMPDIYEIPVLAPKGNYGEVEMKPVLSLFDCAAISDARSFISSFPKTFVQLKANYGYVLYETTIPPNLPDHSLLSIPALKDRAIVCVNQNIVGILSRSSETSSINLLTPPGAKLSLLVENQGRINIGTPLIDIKGMLSEPKLNDTPLNFWTSTILPFEHITWAHLSPPKDHGINPPAIYVGELILPTNENPLDTFIDPSGWGKGIIFVNEFNLGRYWPSIGPQVTLYVPGCYLKPAPQKNIITIVETQFTNPESKIVFRNTHVLDKIPPSKRFFH